MRVILFRGSNHVEVYDNYTIVDVDDEFFDDTGAVGELNDVEAYVSAMENSGDSVRMMEVVVNGAVVWKRGDTLAAHSD